MNSPPQGPHCAQCATYEEAVISRAPGEPFPATILPCEKFAMSDRFRDWAVSQMRSEVGGQISGAGLDRMALLKGKGTPAKPSASFPSPRSFTARKRKSSHSSKPASKDPTQR
jgi:hypothetical protein